MKEVLNIELYTPYKKQREIHNAINLNEVFGVTVVCGRQVGKTLMAINQSIFWALGKPNQTILYILPADSQSDKVYKQTLESMIDTGLIVSYRGQSGKAEIIFNNGSKILYRSALQENTLRGYSVDYLIIDEAAFIDENTVTTILIPTLTVKGKKLLIVTTPKGKNWVYKFFLKSKTELVWKSFKFTSYDSPYANKEFLNSQRLILPEELFAQEYLAEFVDKASIFKNLDDIMVLNDIWVSDNKKYCGVDLGMVDDYTVATIIDGNNTVIDILRFNNVTSTDLKKRLTNFFEQHNPTNIIIEQNGLGRPIVSDLLETKWKDVITPFDTTPKSKKEIIENLIRLFNNKNIKLLNDYNLREELENFIFVNSESGNIKYQASSGFHDDMVMSLAFAVEALNRGGKKEFDYFFTSL